MRILLVEDDLRLATTIRRGLIAEGFSVDTADDGESGAWLASEHEYAAIVLDIMLPKLNGFQVCARLRAEENWTPILMLTAKDGELDEAEALDTGADDYLTKPFSFVVLVAHLRALIRRGGAERPAVITVGDLEVDPSNRSCQRGGTAIELTAKEFAIVELLARRQGDVASKADLLAHAWDFAYDGDPSVIDVHISNIRRKIDRPFGIDTLVTVRNAGYRLLEPTASAT
jgi:DNA-binding response OmpR family regulator